MRSLMIVIVLALFRSRSTAFQSAPLVATSYPNRLAFVGDKVRYRYQPCCNNGGFRLKLLIQKMAESKEDEQVEKSGSLRGRIRRIVRAPFRRLKRLLKREEKREEGLSSVSSEEATTEREKTTSAISSSTASSSTVRTPEPSGAAAATVVAGDAIETRVATPASISTTRRTTVKRQQFPVGDRWAVSAPDVDLSGKWSLIVTDQFKEEYDNYLTLLGQPLLVRSIALSIVGMTSEETEQAGENLFIRGRNVRGTWERTLQASGTTTDGDVEFTPNITSIVTADGEHVQAEAWWEQQGTVHRSWLRGVERYGGGAFESRRYLDNDGKVLVCESVFHPNDTTREDAKVTWRFLKEGETL